MRSSPAKSPPADTDMDDLSRSLAIEKKFDSAWVVEDGPSNFIGYSVNKPLSDSGNTSEWESLAQGPIQPIAQLADITSEKDGAMKPLIKASPPMPSGSQVGRYRIRIWRATPRQTFGINFVLIDGKITIGEDVVHLGLRQGDELVRVNHLNAARIDECRQILADATYVDMLLQHRELGEHVVQQDTSCSLNPFGQQSSRRQEDDGDNEKQCCSSRRQGDSDIASQPLQAVLSVSKPSILRTTYEGAVEFEISVQRSSLMQRLGISFAFEPQLPTMSRRTPPKMLIAQDVYSLGLQQGDHVLLVNGVPYSRAADCQKILETSSNVCLRLKRPSSPNSGYVPVAMATEVQQSDDVLEVAYGSGAVQPAPGCGIFCR